MRASPKHPTTGAPRPGGIHSTRLHVSLYSALLVMTPFIMLRTYMQDALGRFSTSRVTLIGVSVPAVLVLAGVPAIVALILLRRRIRVRHVLAGLLGLAMFRLGQLLTDYYFGHRFYEVQQNWHYIAYSIFAFMVYRDQRSRGAPLARYMLITFGLAFLYSSFDEWFQLFINSRIFDPCDVAKDVWGAIIGMTVLLVGGRHTELRAGAWHRVRQASLRDWFRHAPSVWVLLAVLGFLFLIISSLLTDSHYLLSIVLITLGSWVVVFGGLHLSRFRWPGRALLALGVIAAVALGQSYLRHRDDGIGRHQYGLTICQGIPIPYFDVLVFPDGHFRPVDKKHYFTPRDRIFIEKRHADIVLIGTGYRGLGGFGFPHQKGSRFVYNAQTERGMQVIIENSREACEHYSRLKEQGKRVLLILHSTC
jgi:hypothetical protein